MDQLLYNQLRSIIMDMNEQMDVLRKEADKMGLTSPYLIRDQYGGFILAPLLIAKANALHGLALLKHAEKS